jgi:hypothetical protein
MRSESKHRRLNNVRDRPFPLPACRVEFLASREGMRPTGVRVAKGAVTRGASPLRPFPIAGERSRETRRRSRGD